MQLSVPDGSSSTYSTPDRAPDRNGDSDEAPSEARALHLNGQQDAVAKDEAIAANIAGPRQQIVLRKKSFRIFSRGSHDDISAQPRSAVLSRLREKSSTFFSRYRITLPAAIAYTPSQYSTQGTTHEANHPRFRMGQSQGTSCLTFVDAKWEDGSSVADYPTPRNHDGQRDSKQSMVHPTSHKHANMAFDPLPNPHVCSPTVSEHARFAGILDTEECIPDLGVFDSRNASSPVRGLYRNYPGHLEQLVEQDMANQNALRQQYEQAVGSDGRELSPLSFKVKNDKLGGFTVGDSNQAQQLAALKPRHRGGIIVSKQAPAPTSELIAMDTDNESHRWRVYTSCNQLNAIDSGDPILSDPRDPDAPRVPRHRAGRGHSIIHTVTYESSANFQASKLHIPVMGPDVSEAALPHQMDATNTVTTPIANEVCNANVPESTPVAFQDHISRPLPMRIRSGVMASTNRLPTPFPSPIPEGDESRTANATFFGAGSATEEVVALVQTLEDERDRLARQNRAIIAALDNSNDQAECGLGAYETGRPRASEHIVRLCGENAVLRSELANKDSEIMTITELLVEKDMQIQRLRNELEH